ncbi:glutaredoxin family protein [Aquirhabdus parva]|uniref:Glutaredoxin family protein n=1 Tax=Aquirhabdus parva TaxID=2283318 RepID=A0A345P650_9GAMM|nr:glutaredoxin family protein [Aquirhabdus parva]AXI02759.1 glutaredoxin family protein [Aquirhabdus parva]
MTWILYATQGCHLCENATLLLQQLAMARFVDWYHQDIIDLAQEETERLGLFIPVLKIKHEEHHWPFSLVELIQWHQEQHQTAVQIPSEILKSTD